MLKRTVTYTNLDGVEVSKDLYFNVSANELVEKEANSNQTYSEKLKAVGESNQLAEVYPVILEFLRDGYGIRTENGEFIKDGTGAAWDAFRHTMAFEALMDDLLMDPNQNGNKLADFIMGMLPANLSAKIQEQNAVPGFRPGADTARPTPPVNVQPAIDQGWVPSENASPVVVEAYEAATQAPQPVEVAPAEPIQAVQFSEPREPELPGQPPQQ